MESFAYEIPSAAGGDEGLEGFSVEAHGERVGRLAAINRTPAGLVLLVDTGDAYRPVPAAEVAEVQMGGHTILLTAGGERAFAAAPAVDPRTNPAEGPRLVRHIPPELLRLMTSGGTRRSRSRLWFVGGGLVLLAGFAILPVHLLIEHEVGGAARWAWLAVPLGLLVAAGWAFAAAIDRDAGRRVPLRAKLADAPALFLGISPGTRKRG
jgi:hypothetical protein